MYSEGALGTPDKAPVCKIFNSYLEQSFNSIQRETGDIESERAMFSISIVEAAALSCGYKGLGACHGANPRTRQCLPELKGVIALKKSY